MKTITTGILGAGRIGRLHGDNILRMHGVDLRAVADPYTDFESWPEAAVTTGEDQDLWHHLERYHRGRGDSIRLQ